MFLFEYLLNKFDKNRLKLLLRKTISRVYHIVGNTIGLHDKKY